MSSGRRGVTMIECLVAASLFLAVTALVSASFTSAVGSLSKVHSRTDYVLNLQVLGANFVRDTQATWMKGIEISTDGYACPSPQSPDGPRLESQSATLMVQSYHLYYRRPAQREAWLRVIPLSSPRRLTPPLSESDVGWGLQPFSFYTTQGKKLASELDLFQVRARGNSLVLQLRGSHRHHGQVAPETIDLEFVASPRNS